MAVKQVLILGENLVNVVTRRSSEVGTVKVRGRERPKVTERIHLVEGEMHPSFSVLSGSGPVTPPSTGTQVHDPVVWCIQVGPPIPERTDKLSELAARLSGISRLNGFIFGNPERRMKLRGKVGGRVATRPNPDTGSRTVDVALLGVGSTVGEPTHTRDARKSLHGGSVNVAIEHDTTTGVLHQEKGVSVYA